MTGPVNVKSPLRFAVGLAGSLLLAVATAAVLAQSPPPDASANSQPAGDTLPADEPLPAGERLPAGELGRVIQLGRAIIEHTDTHPLSEPFVGNKLTCSSCHLDAGTHPHAATFLGVATAYPAWSPREKRVITLEDRILNCFMRSMNGTRPPNGSEVSVAMTAYISWLSAGASLRMNPQRPLGPRHLQPLSVVAEAADTKRGEELYQQQCADCHGELGQGSDEGPPVWGTNSYNDGAGLARVDKLAAWLKVAMPLGDPTLSEQDAVDVAAFVNAHPRPKFILSDHLPNAERLGEYNADRSTLGSVDSK